MTATPAHGLQPLLHDAVVALRAPAQIWSGRDGSIGGRAIDGVYVSDVRVVAGLTVAIGGSVGEHIATLTDDASTVRFVSLQRSLDESGADPDTRAVLTRRALPQGVTHELALESRLAGPLTTEVVVDLSPDLTPMETIKAGIAPSPHLAVGIDGERATWDADGVTVTVTATGATLSPTEGGLRMTWRLEVPPRGTAAVAFHLAADDVAAVVHEAPAEPPWSDPDVSAADERLQRWVARALDDLDALRLMSTRAPGGQFFAAGAPWFFTLFGRDAIWAARLSLALGPAMASGTLGVLAALQGTTDDPETAEQPGKIPHELRRAAAAHEGFTLPPLYYGTVDATPLWICLLADARAAGMPEESVRALLPNLRAALTWMRDFGDSDGDGLLEYIDVTGRGLSNQGWKDSGDSVQWRTGELAEGPIALCEVQAYAYEAAMRGADLLDAFGDEGDGDEWRAWAARLADRFRETFWIDDPAGAYPAIALDARKRPVDTVTSNLGHLLGTGLLRPDEAALVARRLVSPELDSGFGLRTMSTDSAGYWPLSYHGGSVWTHDTAIAITGLARDGFPAEAAQLSEGLLRAAVAFDYRMPELHSGDPASAYPAPVPYPAACRPQAWSAAAAIAVWDATR
jgi:glycogen debranching enzyme